MGTKKLTSSNHINKTLLEERCILNKVLKLTGKRWLAEVLLLVEIGVNRFSQLKNNMDGISDHILSQNLNLLLSAGLLTKITHQDVGAKVEYQLSTSGKELMSLLHGLCSWGEEHLEV